MAKQKDEKEVVLKTTTATKNLQYEKSIWVFKDFPKGSDRDTES